MHNIRHISFINILLTFSLLSLGISEIYNISNKNFYYINTSINVKFKYCKTIQIIMPIGSNDNTHVNKIVEDINLISTVIYCYYDSTLYFSDKIRTASISTDCFIILVNEINTLYEIPLLLDNNDVPWNYRTNILILCDLNCSFDHFIDDFYATRKLNDFVNALIIDSRKSITYEVCTSSKIIKQFNELENQATNDKLLPKCKVDLHGQLISTSIFNANPFIKSVVHGKTINVRRKDPLSINQFIGLEPELLKTMEKVFNFKVNLKYYFPRDRHIEEMKNNNEVLASFYLLDKGKIKLVTNLMTFGTFNSFKNIIYSWPIFNEKPCLVINTSIFTSNILNLFEIFEFLIYVALIIVLITIILVWMTISRLVTKNKINDGSIVMMSISLMCGGGAYRY